MTNKKGIFFITLVIIMLALFLLSATFFSQVALRKSIQKRVETLSQFVSATEEDLERQLYIFGFRTIYLIEEEIVKSTPPAHVSSVDSIFQEAFFSGTVNGQSEALLSDAKFDAIKSKIQERARKISTNITISDPSIEITQDDPWNIKLTFTSNFTVQDKNNLALWNKTLVIVSYIPITGFSDPLYAIETAGIVTVNITKTPYETFVSGGDTSNLTSHINNQFYKASTSAPSFINRLEGNYFGVSDPNGIESFVYLPQLQAQIPSYVPTEKSVIDYIYFSSDNPNFCIVQPSVYPSWFRLDNQNNHLANYNVSWPVGC